MIKYNGVKYMLKKNWLLTLILVLFAWLLMAQNTDQKTYVALQISPENTLPDTLENFFYVQPQKLVKEVFYAMTSFYGKRFSSKKTANGESHERETYTAAHRTLPFNTILRLTNEDNGKSVIVRINDRGPFRRGRDLDISWYAARDLEITQKGIKKLKVEVLEKEPEPDQVSSR